MFSKQDKCVLSRTRVKHMILKIIRTTDQVSLIRKKEERKQCYISLFWKQGSAVEYIVTDFD